MDRKKQGNKKDTGGIIIYIFSLVAILYLLIHAVTKATPEVKPVAIGGFSLMAVMIIIFFVIDRTRKK